MQYVNFSPHKDRKTTLCLSMCKREREIDSVCFTERERKKDLTLIKLNNFFH